MTAHPPTDAEIIVDLLPAPKPKRKSGGVRKASKKKERPVRRVPWYQNLQHEILQAVINPLLRTILNHGVRNITAFHEDFQRTCGTVSMKTFREWLHALGLMELFETPPLIRLDVPQPRGPVATRPVDDGDIIRDINNDEELNELGIREVTFNPEGMHVLQMDVVSPPSPDVVVPPSVAPLLGGAPSGWTPPPDPFAPVVEKDGTPRTLL